MNKLALQNYNLDLTLLGGQSFTWEKVNDCYVGTHKDNLMILKLEDNNLYWQTYPEENNLKLLKSYLNLDFNYDEVIKSISNDEYVNKAIEFSSGVRILKQDFETVLLNFILSSHKSVKAVRKLVKDISRKYGKKFKTDYGEAYSFPSPKVLAALTEKELREIGAGFRASYLKSAAEKLVNDKEIIESFGKKSTKEIKEYLISFKGIGDKIADCILVFGLGKLDTTPLDIWGKRVLTEFYKLNPKMNYSQMSNWYSSKFENNTAIAGQILFEYIRKLPNSNKAKQK